VRNRLLSEDPLDDLLREFLAHLERVRDLEEIFESGSRAVAESRKEARSKVAPEFPVDEYGEPRIDIGEYYEVLHEQHIEIYEDIGRSHEILNWLIRVAVYHSLEVLLKCVAIEVFRRATVKVPKVTERGWRPDKWYKKALGIDVKTLPEWDRLNLLRERVGKWKHQASTDLPSAEQFLKEGHTAAFFLGIVDVLVDDPVCDHIDAARSFGSALVEKVKQVSPPPAPSPGV
jgi:hypothetical protein